MSRIRLFAAGVLLLLAQQSYAAGFFDADQDSVRADADYLVDTGIIHLPVSAWPIPVDDLRVALDAVTDQASLNPAELRAYQRLRSQVAGIDTPAMDSLTMAGSLHPTPFRGGEPLPREEGNLTSVAGGREASGFTAHVATTLVTSPVDKQVLRLDGSYAAIQAGNWLLSAGLIPHSWGPSPNDSIILSNNARPIPAFSLDRMLSTAPRSRWLSWIGPWRFSIFAGTLEHARQDVPDPLFAGARLTFKPWRDLEVGLTRTSQFCGMHRSCGLNTVKDLLFGNTNTGTSSNVTAATDPGNDEAGFDIRWVSPLGHLPYAIYGQMIGEDQQSGVPFKYMGEFGLDSWLSFNDGGAARINLEYANTTCSFTTQVIYDCAYRHYIYNKEGYRYKGRVIGSEWEGDSAIFSVHLAYLEPSGNEWHLHARHGQLNRGGVPDPFNIVAPTKRDLDGVDLEYRWSAALGDFRAGLGIDRLRDPATANVDDTPRAYLSWRYRL